MTPADLSQLRDEDLMVLLQQGNRLAFAELLSRYVDSCYRLAYRVLFQKEEAEDVVQGAFLKLWENPSRWQGERQLRFRSWFYRVVINLSLDHKKKKRPTVLAETGHFMAEQKNVDEMLANDSKKHQLSHCLQSLPDRQHEALNLCFYEGLTNKEAAQALGIHLKALESLIVRAKQALKKCLKKI